MAKQSSRKYQDVRLPLIGAMSNRTYSGDKDQRFVNIYPETRKVEQLENIKIFLQKRPGLSLYQEFIAGEGRGLILFDGVIYCVIDDKLWVNTDPPTSIQTLSTSTGPLGMILGNSATTGDYMFFCDGTDAYVVTDTSTCTKVTDIDFPTPHIPSPVFIDGYILVAQNSDVYNCDLDDPLSWDATNFLSAEAYPDPVVALARQNNQVVVFGETSVQFFFDAANASGSPLSNNDGAIIQIGCAAPYCLYQNEKFVAFVGQSASGGRAVWFIDGFTPKKASDEYIDRILDAEENMEDCRGFGIRISGHLFYVINLFTTQRTLVYDVDEKLWHEWSSQYLGAHLKFKCDYAVDAETGVNYLLDDLSGTVYTLDSGKYCDAGINPPHPNARIEIIIIEPPPVDCSDILVELVTNKFDMDTYNRKFMSGVQVVSDRYLANSVDISWTDDDYETYNVPFTISLSDDYPALKQLGSFRRRAFKITHQLEQPLRIESLEVRYKEGEH